VHVADFEGEPVLDLPSLRSDPEVNLVRDELQRIDPDGARTARVIRESIDMLYDGRHTGRFRWDQLFKTEKTHAGTLLEINLQREFGFKDGDRMDFKISGVDVDCKYSQRKGAWMIPPEAVGQVCLVVWFSDEQSRWELGVVRADKRILGAGANRDLKRTIRMDSRGAICWVHQDARLPENALLRLPTEDINAIFTVLAGKGNGQKRVNELFRRAQGLLISRAVVETVAMQDDPMKRVRSNRGARSNLKNEGIVIFGDAAKHRALAEKFGLPVPGRGEFVSTRLTPYRENGGSSAVEIAGSAWMLASGDDTACTAPDLPQGKAEADD
jgi:hypothetical protein